MSDEPIKCKINLAEKSLRCGSFSFDVLKCCILCEKKSKNNQLSLSDNEMQNIEDPEVGVSISRE